jgi:hypothetical protein
MIISKTKNDIEETFYPERLFYRWKRYDQFHLPGGIIWSIIDANKYDLRIIIVYPEECYEYHRVTRGEMCELWRKARKLNRVTYVPSKER